MTLTTGLNFTAQSQHLPLDLKSYSLKVRMLIAVSFYLAEASFAITLRSSFRLYRSPLIFGNPFQDWRRPRVFP